MAGFRARPEHGVLIEVLDQTLNMKNLKTKELEHT